MRQLLLVERLDEAARRAAPAAGDSSRAQATLAWIDWRRGGYRPAIVAMKRAYPEWISEAGDRLPPRSGGSCSRSATRTELRAAAQAESLDPALVAALILQESTFDAGGAQPRRARAA